MLGTSSFLALSTLPFDAQQLVAAWRGEALGLFIRFLLLFLLSLFSRQLRCLRNLHLARCDFWFLFVVVGDEGVECFRGLLSTGIGLAGDGGRVVLAQLEA